MGVASNTIMVNMPISTVLFAGASSEKRESCINSSHGRGDEVEDLQGTYTNKRAGWSLLGSMLNASRED